MQCLWFAIMHPGKSVNMLEECEEKLVFHCDPFMKLSEEMWKTRKCIKSEKDVLNAYRLTLVQMTDCAVSIIRFYLEIEYVIMVTGYLCLRFIST